MKETLFSGRGAYSIIFKGKLVTEKPKRKRGESGNDTYSDGKLVIKNTRRQRICSSAKTGLAFKCFSLGIKYK